MLNESLVPFCCVAVTSLTGLTVAERVCVVLCFVCYFQNINELSNYVVIDTRYQRAQCYASV